MSIHIFQYLLLNYQQINLQNTPHYCTILCQNHFLNHITTLHHKIPSPHYHILLFHALIFSRPQMFHYKLPYHHYFLLFPSHSFDHFKILLYKYKYCHWSFFTHHNHVNCYQENRRDMTLHWCNKMPPVYFICLSENSPSRNFRHQRLIILPLKIGFNKINQYKFFNTHLIKIKGSLGHFLPHLTIPPSKYRYFYKPRIRTYCIFHLNWQIRYIILFLWAN